MKPSDDPSNVPADPTAANNTPSLRAIFAAVAFWVLVGVALAVYFRWKLPRKPLPEDPDQALQVAVEEADRLDPGWRLEELEAKRDAIADADNSALCVLAAHERLPKGWPTWRSLDRLAGRELARSARYRYEDDIRKVPADIQFNAQQLAVLKGELREAEAALTEARKLTDLSRGRLPPGPPSKAAFLGSNPHLEQVRKIMELLEMDAKVRTQDGKLDDALASCRAILNAGRAIGDEPDSIAQLVRLACESTAVNKLERILAQGVPSPAALASAQQLLEDEAKVPTLLTVARGERARMDFFLRKIHDGGMTTEEIEKLENLATSMAASLRGRDGSGSSASEGKWYAPQRINWYRAWFLRYSSDLVELCKVEPPSMEDLEKLEATLRGQPAILRLCVGGKEKIVADCWRNQAKLRCAVVALAVERYRQTNGRWPDALTDLVPGLIARIPADPYDGRRLRYGRVRRGVSVYSIGSDGKDNKGDLRDPTLSQQAADVGFRLWNPNLRRHAPQPVQALDELPGNDDD